MRATKCLHTMCVAILQMTLVGLVLGGASRSDGVTCYPDLPDPGLISAGWEDYTVGGQTYTRYWLSVANWQEFPDTLFEPAPDLPPCGQNPNASRTWVDIYQEDDTRLNRFCALSSAEDLTGIWFSLPKGTTPPDCVYITVTDRRCDIEYTSNLVCTLLSVPVHVDIKPTSCPNPLNVNSNGVLPVALLGTADFDVIAVDLASIRLEGVAPLRSSVEDVATPVSDGAGDCACTTEGPDGYLDLTLKFDAQQVVSTLGQVNDGEVLPLTLTGLLLEEYSGLALSGTDCVVILAKGGQCPEPLVINGDFEAPMVMTPEGWDVFPSGTPGLGWMVEWVMPDPAAPQIANLELQRGVSGWTSYDGAQHVELDSDWEGPDGAFGQPASVRIYQDVCTKPGRTYTLSYAWSPRPGYPDNVLEVYWNGSIVATHSGSGSGSPEWTAVTLSGFEGATPPAKTTHLEFVEAGPADSWGMLLDAVSLTEEKGKQGKK